MEEEKTEDNTPEEYHKTKVISHERRKHRTFDEKLKNAPKTVIVHELTEEEKICPKCGSQMTVIGYDSFIQVEYIPARIEVQEHRKEKASAANAVKMVQREFSEQLKHPSR